MTLLFAGDFCPFDGYVVRFDNQLKKRVAAADFSFVNLECPLTNEKIGIDKCGPNLKASPGQISVLKELGVNGVTLANNHLLDYGGQAVLDTIRICESNGIRTVGAGKDLESARGILLLEKHDVRVAILNVAEREFSIAATDSPGANPLDLINILRDLEKARKLAKRIVLVIHGGLEHVPYPSPESIRLLRFLAEQANVVAVIRHHPHIIQGMERWNDVPIYYSLGNFYFPERGPHSDAWYEGLVVEMDIGEEEVVIRHFPSKLICDGDVQVLSVAANLVLPDVAGPEASLAWRQAFQSRQDGYLATLFSPWFLWRRIVAKSKLYHWIKPSRRQVLKVQDYLRCPAHQEVLSFAIDNHQSR